MNVQFNILYKNGIEDKIQQNNLEEQKYHEIYDFIDQILRSEQSGNLILGDKTDKSQIVRMSDVSRIDFEIVGE